MRSTVLTQLGVAALLCGCGLVGGQGKGDEEPAVPRELTLHVENQNFYDATIYAIGRGGEEQRIGQVTGNNQATFTFHWAQDEIRVFIRLLASGATVTDRLLVNPGDSLELVITPDLHLKIP